MSDFGSYDCFGCWLVLLSFTMLLLVMCALKIVIFKSHNLPAKKKTRTKRNEPKEKKMKNKKKKKEKIIEYTRSMS